MLENTWCYINRLTWKFMKAALCRRKGTLGSKAPSLESSRNTGLFCGLINYSIRLKNAWNINPLVTHAACQFLPSDRCLVPGSLIDSGYVVEVTAIGHKPVCHHPPPRTNLCFTADAHVSPIYSRE